MANFSCGFFFSYVYDAAGTKLKKTVSGGGSVTEYAGNYVYQANALQFFGQPEGYVTPDGSGGYDYIYQYKDHLGNVRLSFVDNSGTTEIVEESNYYPFGLKHKGYNTGTSPLGNDVAQKWKFGGKEYDDSFNYDMYEFELRHYDAALGRFVTTDPYEQFYSPYLAMGNNPIVAFDPDGGNCFDVNGDPIVCPNDSLYDDYRDNGENHITILDGAGGVAENKSSELDGPRIDLTKKENLVDYSDTFLPIQSLTGFEHAIAEIELNLFGYRNEEGSFGKYHVDAQGNVIFGPYAGGVGPAVGLIGGPKKAPNVKLNTSSLTRRQAFRKAKDANKVPRSQQPDRVFTVREKGTGKLLKVYEYTNSSGKKVLIRGDNARIYKDGGIQGAHFNAGEKGSKLKQHHYYDN